MSTPQERARLIKRVQKGALNNQNQAVRDVVEMERELKKAYKKAEQDMKKALLDISEEMARRGGSTTHLDFQRGRYKTLLSRIKKISHDLGKTEEDITANGLMGLYVDQYLRSTYNIGQAVDVKVDFALINKQAVREAVYYPFEGDMFSERIWDNQRNMLVKQTRENITQGFIQGWSVQKIATKINDVMQKGYFNAQRVARTESMRISYIADKKAWEKAGITKLRFYATYDERTCKVCGPKHGKVFKSGSEPMLPVHPMCRCTYLPIVFDSPSQIGTETRKMRQSQDYQHWMDKWRRANQITRRELQTGIEPTRKPRVELNGDYGQKIASEMNESVRESLWELYNRSNNKEIFDGNEDIIDRIMHISKDNKDAQEIKANFEKMRKVFNKDYDKPFSYLLTSKKVKYGANSSTKVHYLKIIDDFEEFDGGKFYLKVNTKVSKAEKDDMVQGIREALKKNPKGVGVKFLVDNKELGANGLGYYSPSLDMIALRTKKNYTAKISYKQWEGTLAHEMAHRGHNQYNKKRLSQLVVSEKQWDDWQDTIEDYYKQYREGQTVNFGRDWRRFSYPVNCQDHYKDKGKYHFYNEIWAEANAVRNEGGEELEKLEKYFPKIKPFLDNYYKEE